MKICLLLVSVSISLVVSAQINPAKVTIARDSFGIPHIFGKTDAEVAYGLAWVHSEDDFKNIQYNILAGKNMLGRVLGKDGVLFDFGLQFLNISETVNAKYETDISPEYKKVLEGYAQGLNAYAAAHPKEVLLKKAFPVTAKEILRGAVLQTSLMGGVGMAIKSIRDGRIKEFYQINDIGSNALAIAPTRTDDGKTWLAINSHQPIEGRFAWYEAHLQSDEGWNIIGGLFPGGSTIFVGSNEHLGWAHTTNYHTFGDIYKIEINPKNKNQYKYDGQWLEFGKRIVKLKVKIAGIKLPAKRTVLLTEYGPTFKGKDGLYAIRFPAYNDIRATDQWYQMNKAKSFAEFEAAVKMQAIPLFNIVYGDNEGNIYLHSGGIVPKRNPELNWSHPITGTSSQFKWTATLPYEEMPTVLNPECGFVYNCNNTPLCGAGEACEWKGDFIGLHRFTYNRGERFKYLLEKHEGKFTWADFHRIKFDKSYHTDSTASYRSHFKNLYSLDEKKYPDIADAILKFKRWNLSGEAENKDAALALVTHDYLLTKLDAPFAFFMIAKSDVPEADALEAVRYAKKFLLKTHGSIDVPLGDVQRLIRGKVSVPASGLREVARAADGKLYDKKKGIYKVVNGDGYIQLVKFSKNALPEIYSINAYGASSNPDSPHYTDQMEMFQKEQFRKMTFDKNTIMKHALRIYNPG
ncbi:MAG: penicillin acylase family protein [Chitinophagales bacterium]|nr:penicillin acylase family protein [Chitinophagales bacterium]